MATIIVEDGSIVAGANSYISEANLTTYATDRGITIVGTKADLLIQAMDYIEQQYFIGLKYTQDQPLQWPRAGVEIDEFPIAVTEIPTLLIEALAETALAIDAGNSPIADLERTKQQVTVGPVSVTYAEGGNSAVVVRKISNKLAKLITGSGGINFEVTR